MSMFLALWTMMVSKLYGEIGLNYIDEGYKAQLYVYHPCNWHCCSLNKKLDLNNIILQGGFIKNLLLAFKHGNNHTLSPCQYEMLASFLVEVFVRLICYKNA